MAGGDMLVDRESGLLLHFGRIRIRHVVVDA
jgi:hypothetical protein